MQQQYQSHSLSPRNADDGKSHFHVAKDKKDKIQQGFYNELHWLPSAQYCFSSVLEYCETYRGDDNASSTDEQRSLVSVRINSALSGLGNGWCVHIDAIRRHSPNYSDPGLSDFPDLVTAAIDEERRRQFEGYGNLFEGVFVLTVTFFPPLLAQAKFVELMFDDDAQKPDRKRRTTNLIEQFKRDVQNIEDALSSAFKMTRLKGIKTTTEDGKQETKDDFLQYLPYRDWETDRKSVV